MIETPTETKKIRINKAYSVAALFLIIGLLVGYVFGDQKFKVNSKLQIKKGTPPVSQSADYSLLWDALNELNTKYVDRPLDQQKLMYGAVAGLVAAAGDPYTTFFDPTTAKQFADQLKGTFDGIGAEVGVKDEQIVVIAPLDDTPAQKAGIVAGDAILAINGESTVSMTVDQAVSKIRGQAGTDVTLTILHQGKKQSQDIKITRAHINVKSVKMEEKDDNGKKVAVITVSQFGDDTKQLFEQAVEKTLADNDTGIIIDLRNDPGGYLDTAVAIASNWVDSGQTVVKEVDYKGETNSHNASGVNRLKGIKTVVLVNGGSASASEILSGALQDYGYATLVGEKTFGKGSVQQLDDLSDGSQIKVTIAKWFTPKDRGINHTGLEPDIKIARTSDDINANRDPQMDKALELLK